MKELNTLIPELILEVKAWETLQEEHPLFQLNTDVLISKQEQMGTQMQELGKRVSSLQGFIQELGQDMEKLAAAIREQIESIVQEKFSDVMEMLAATARDAIQDTKAKIDAFILEISEAFEFLSNFVEETIDMFADKAAQFAKYLHTDIESLKESVLSQFELTEDMKNVLMQQFESLKRVLFGAIEELQANVKDTMTATEDICQRLSSTINLVTTSLESASIGLTESASAIEMTKDAVVSPL